jgi:hypothetical protein
LAILGERARARRKGSDLRRVPAQSVHVIRTSWHGHCHAGILKAMVAKLKALHYTECDIYSVTYNLDLHGAIYFTYLNIFYQVKLSMFYNVCW